MFLSIAYKLDLCQIYVTYDCIIMCAMYEISKTAHYLSSV